MSTLVELWQEDQRSGSCRSPNCLYAFLAEKGNTDCLVNRRNCPPTPTTKQEHAAPNNMDFHRQQRKGCFQEKKRQKANIPWWGKIRRRVNRKQSDQNQRKEKRGGRTVWQRKSCGIKGGVGQSIKKRRETRASASGKEGRMR